MGNSTCDENEELPQEILNAISKYLKNDTDKLVSVLCFLSNNDNESKRYIQVLKTVFNNKEAFHVIVDKIAEDTKTKDPLFEAVLDKIVEHLQDSPEKLNVILALFFDREAENTKQYIKKLKVAFRNENAFVNMVDKLVEEINTNDLLTRQNIFAIPNATNHEEVQNSSLKERTNKVVANMKNVEGVEEKDMGNVIFGLVNARSLAKKMDELKDQIKKSKLDIVAVTETWFKKGTHLKKLCPEGFEAVHEPREEGKGGGVAIFYRDNLKITRHSLTDYKSFEYIDVSIVIDSNKKIRLIVIYRPTGSSKREFLEEFNHLLQASKGEKEKSLITVGDFNMKIIDIGTGIDRAFLEFIKSQGLEQHVKVSTHEKDGILDLIITRQSDSLVKNVQVSGNFSDHKFVQCDIHIQAKTDDIFEREE